MVKNIIHIEGMSCGMCEAHIADTIRHAFPHAAHVSASRSKKEATFVTEIPVEEAVIKKAIDETGYTYKGMKTEPYEKKGFFSRLFG